MARHDEFPAAYKILKKNPRFFNSGVCACLAIGILYIVWSNRFIPNMLCKRCGKPVERMFEMHCPFCGFNETRVVDSRTNEQGTAVRRRRECQQCEKRFTTFEQIEEIPITVIKEGNGREPFNRNKLLEGLMRATVKREVPRVRLERLVDEIEVSLRNEFNHEISSRDLGERVLKLLKEIDRVAYIRFASVYRNFKDLDEFTKELGSLK